jgi:hypothetical protein
MKQDDLDWVDGLNWVIDQFNQRQSADRQRITDLERRMEELEGQAGSARAKGHE